MTDHKKPTKEELEANIRNLTEEIEKLDKENPAPEPLEIPEDVTEENNDSTVETTEESTETQDNTTEEADDTDDDEEEDSDEVTEEKVEIKEDTTETEDKKDETDLEKERLKKNLTDSTRESYRLFKNNSEMNEAIAEANALPEPTEDELKAEYSDWDELSDTQQAIAKESLINKRFRDTINKAAQEQRKIEQWDDKINKFITDPQTFIATPELEGKQTAFKEYAAQKNLRGTDLSILVGSFLFEQSKKTSVKHKGQMFPTGQGASKTKPQKPNNGKLSLEQGTILRQTDFKKYLKFLKAGKIDNGLPASK